MMRGPRGRLLRFDRRMRWLAAGCAMLLIPTLMVPLVGAQAADSDVVQTEVLQVDLTGTGAPGEVQALERLEMTGQGDIETTTDTVLMEIRGVGSNPDVDNGTVRYREGVDQEKATNVYFEGNAELLDSQGLIKTPDGNRRLPLDVSTRFTFDGVEVTDLDSIAGKTGTFKMEIEIENRSGTMQDVTYRDSTSGRIIEDTGFAFVPFTVVMGPWYFDTPNWENLTVSGGVIDQRGSTSIVSTANVLFPPNTPGSIKLEVQGNTRSFDLNSGRVVAKPGIGIEQSDIVKAESKSSGTSSELYRGLQQFFDDFELLSEDLSDFVDIFGALVDEALGLVDDVLRNLNAFVASVETDLQVIHDSLVRITGIVEELAVSVDAAKHVLGGSTYSNPLCKPQSVVNPNVPVAGGNNDIASQCRLVSSDPLPPLDQRVKDAPLLPPQEALDTVTNIAQNPGTGQTETVTRVEKGQIPTEVGSTQLLPDGSYLGSIWNIAALLAFSGSSPTDGNLDGNPDFREFSWPNPNSSGFNRSLYPSADLNRVVIPEGFYYPGSGHNATYPDPSPLFNSLCNQTTPEAFGASPAIVDTSDLVDTSLGPLPILDVKITNFLKFDVSKGSTSGPCSNIPTSDISLEDLITNSAAPKWPDIPVDMSGVRVCQGSEIGFLPTLPPTLLPNTVCDTFGPTMNVSAELDAGAMFSQGTDRGVQHTLEEQADGYDITCTDVGGNFTNEGNKRFLAWFCGTNDPTKFSSSSREWGTFGLVNNQKNVVLEVGAALSEEINSFNDISQRPGGTFPGCFFPLSIFLSGDASLTCDFAVFGALGGIQAVGTAVEEIIANPAWNWDNWYRGDPGFQVTDTSAATGPRLSQVLNILAFFLERERAWCPATIVTSPAPLEIDALGQTIKVFLPGFADQPGSGTPRVVPPALNTKCSDVLPANQDAILGLIGTDAVTALRDITAIIGDPSNPKFTPSFSDSLLGQATSLLGISIPSAVSDFLTAPYPEDLASTLDYAISLINTQAPGLIDQVTTLVDDAIGPLEEQAEAASLGAQFTGLLIGQVGNEEIAHDLNAALTQAGMKLLEDYGPFMGPTTFNGSTAEGELLIVFEVQGTRPEQA